MSLGVTVQKTGRSSMWSDKRAYELKIADVDNPPLRGSSSVAVVGQLQKRRKGLGKKKDCHAVGWSMLPDGQECGRTPKQEADQVSENAQRMK